ncbi:hypothetical protein [Paramagnetospirillum magneticum]|uniref:Uncharacterized protein n=1 Tax=Paramagnetospirillum magneticum (strain ATCC 700264 / AMB-1) TaxID=342108 RepID=Q2WA43_PARM1|nr:hypothetical protein [Paramagnetospirillum magneticum]BAE49282.1 hypothetical protein amb0478 [Paramagnetospirillum magneticum AMB-1]
MTATFVQPDSTAQDSTTYKANIDAATAVVAVLGRNFAPHQAEPANMTVVLDAGSIQGNTSVVAHAAQVTPAFIAPVANPRLDLVVVDASTGVVSVVAGAEAAATQLPTVPSGKIAVAQVHLAVGMAAIGNSDITDLRTPFRVQQAVLGVAGWYYDDATDALHFTMDSAGSITLPGNREEWTFLPTNASCALDANGNLILTI